MSQAPLTLKSKLDELNKKRFEGKIKEALTVHSEVASKITDLLTKGNVPAEEAELILLWLAGMSHGLRGEPVTSDLTLFTLARGWQFAASKVAN